MRDDEENCFNASHQKARQAISHISRCGDYLKTDGQRFTGVMKEVVRWWSV